MYKQQLTSGFVARHKLGMGVATAAVAAVVASASLAGAQVAPPAPDGGPHVDPQPALTTTCGKSLSSTIRTQSTPRTTNAVGFQNLPGAYVENIVVPDGQSRCVKVLLTAETACGPSANPDFCYVRALVGATPMEPNGNPYQAMDSEDATASAHAYEWVQKIGPGVHDVNIQWRVGNAATRFYADDWTMDVQIYEP